MSKDIKLSQEAPTIEKLEAKIQELEELNLQLQNYFIQTTEPATNNHAHSPYSGNHSFHYSFRFAIDLQLQKLVWINLRENIFKFKSESLFLLDVEPLSIKLIAQFDRSRFQEIVARYSGEFQEPMQTIFRLNQWGKKVVWAIALFEKVFYQPNEGILQIEFIKLDEDPEVAKFFSEFTKKTENAATYQRVEMLTHRQREILSLLGLGLTSKEIAEKLKISFHTVEAHRKIIAQKTQTRKRAALICLAAEVGFLNKNPLFQG